MFYMPGTKMLFGDAKDSCEGADSHPYLLWAELIQSPHSYQKRARGSKGVNGCHEQFDIFSVLDNSVYMCRAQEDLHFGPWRPDI
jgi:hypothetical protein